MSCCQQDIADAVAVEVVVAGRLDGRGRYHTNTVEGFSPIFKRGMRGVYQFCSEKHLHRYLAEFDFRYSNRSALVAAI